METLKKNHRSFALVDLPVRSADADEWLLHALCGYVHLQYLMHCEGQDAFRHALSRLV